MKENENEKNIDILTPLQEFFKEHGATLADTSAIDDIDTQKMCFNCKHFKRRNLAQCSGFCQAAARQGLRDDNNELPSINHKMVCDLFVQREKHGLVVYTDVELLELLCKVVGVCLGATSAFCNVHYIAHNVWLAFDKSREYLEGDFRRDV